MNQTEQMREALRMYMSAGSGNSTDFDIQAKAWGMAHQALNHTPDTGKMVEPTPKKFVQSDKGRVAVVINKGANGRLPYGIVIEESVHHSNPILIADFVQEKDALLFAKIWNNEIAEPAMLWPDEKARGRHD